MESIIKVVPAFVTSAKNGELKQLLFCLCNGIQTCERALNITLGEN